MTVAHEAAAWVVVDVAALCVELAGLEWHDIHIAIGEEGRAVSGAGGLCTVCCAPAASARQEF